MARSSKRRPARVAGAERSLEEERTARREAEAAAARISRLQAATAALSSARTPDEVAAAALDAGIAALGGTHGFVLAVGTSGALEVLRCAGMPEDIAQGAASSDNPATEAFRSEVAVFVEDRDALLRRYPQLSRIVERVRGAILALPLRVAGRPVGVLAVGFEGAHGFPDADRALALAVAGQCAQALDRARLYAAERLARTEAVAARRRLAFLDELSALLAATIEEDEMLAGVARLSVPALGEWVGLFTRRDGGIPLLAAQAGPAALGEAIAAHLRADPPARLAAAAAAAEPLVVDDFPADPAGERTVPAAVLAPLVVRGRSLGVLAVATADPIRTLALPDPGLVGDVAHRTALALEHARLLEDATLAARAREEFLQVASHELRGPVGTLRLSVQMLMRSGTSMETRVGRLRAIEKQAQRLATLSDTLLDVSRITAGRLELVRERGDLAALVRDAAARATEAASEAGSRISVEAPDPVRLSFDHARMDQVVSNLVSNAVKYGCGRPIRVSAREESGRARIEVEDRGIGIAPADQERIFGRFERAVSVRHYGGLGLGLWIVRRLVEAHGGTIHVRSVPGEGSTFAIELPFDAPAS